MQRAEFDLSYPACDLSDDCGDYSSHGLARTECIERPQYDHRRPERPLERKRQLVRSNFGCCIGRLRVQRMRFINWNITCGAIDFTSRCANNARDVAVSASLKNI